MMSDTPGLDAYFDRMLDDYLLGDDYNEEDDYDDEEDEEDEDQ